MPPRERVRRLNVIYCVNIRVQARLACWKMNTGKHIKGSASKDTLTEKAYLCIKEGIVRSEIEEGVFLSEKEIMKRYQIGRTPFREACNRLHHEHLLEVVPRRGYLVPQMSLQEVRDLFEVRVRPTRRGNILAVTRYEGERTALPAIK